VQKLLLTLSNTARPSVGRFYTHVPKKNKTPMFVDSDQGPTEYEAEVVTAAVELLE
jgi:hypothetical protein